MTPKEQVRKLRARAQDRGRRDNKSSLTEKERIIIQLQSSLAEREEILLACRILSLRRHGLVLSYRRLALQHSQCVSAMSVFQDCQPLPTTQCTSSVLELSDASGQPCSLRQNVTAELQSADQSSVVPTTVSMWSSSQYEVSYTVLSRGQHKLHVRLNGNVVRGSPFSITVYPHPIYSTGNTGEVDQNIERSLGCCH